MLDNQGFDLWANGYDRAVGLSDENDAYPFAGYKAVLAAIYSRVMESGARDVLDVGFGTGTLAAKLYAQGVNISGQDFSARMLEIAREKMPQASLYQGDFTKGLLPELTHRRYDAIIATYSLHHLTDAEKPGFLRGLLKLLNPGGKLYIGDVAFESRAALEECRQTVGAEWDDEEFYFVADELIVHPEYPLTFEKFSACAGVITLAPQQVV